MGSRGKPLRPPVAHLVSKLMNTPNPRKTEAAQIARATSAELLSMGFSLTRLPKAEKPEKGARRAKTAIQWPQLVREVAQLRAIELPTDAPVKGFSGQGEMVAGPGKEPAATFGSRPVRFASDLPSHYAGPVWALWVAQGGRFSPDQGPAFASLADGQSLALAQLLATVDRHELTGEAFSRLWTGAGSSGILRTLAQYTGRRVTLSLSDFMISLG